MGEVATIKGRIKAISVSEHKGTPKRNVPEADLQIDHGIVGDAHAGSGHRQVSLLAFESIRRLREKGLRIVPGDFAENITTEGLDMRSLKIGAKLKIGDEAELEIAQLGKACHGRCAVYDRLGDCIMPKEGVFARVTGGGRIRVGDWIEITDDQSGDSDNQR
ncbi:MAG: MOSC domain-containing protein [Solirubrobacterales bacterium]